MCLTVRLDPKTWTGFNYQGFTLSVNPNSSLPNVTLFGVLFLQIHCCICRIIVQLYILLLKIRIIVSEVCIILHEIYWIKLKPD